MSNSVTAVNRLITGAIPDLLSLQTAKFGQDFINPTNVGNNLIIHRMTKKWEVPDSSNETQRAERSIKKWLDAEERIQTFTFEFDSEVKWVLMRARMWLSHLFHKFEPSNKVVFSSGETFYSQHGYTSLRQKLLLIEHWTVTNEAANKAAELVWSTNALRKCAWRLMEEHCYDDMARILWSLPPSQTEKEVFILFLKNRIFTYVDGARLALVPKDNTIDRAINVEPMLNMLLQRQIGLRLRSRLKVLHNDLEKGQDVHRMRIRSPSLATIDFSSASEFHMLKAFELMFPSNFVNMVLDVRSPMTLIKTEKLDILHWNEKLSSMGNGFTFEVMTALLLSIARVLDDNATVYGDDVIIRNDKAPLFIRACEALGWVINVDKSFVNSPFRESCGAYYHDDVGYLTSFDLSYCENDTDIIVTANKLRVLSDVATGALKARLTRLWEDVTSVIPVLQKGPMASYNLTYGKMDINPYYVEFENYQRSLRDNERARELYQTNSRIVAFIRDYYQLSSLSVILFTTTEPEIILDVVDVEHPASRFAVISGLVKDRNRNRVDCIRTKTLVSNTGFVMKLDKAWNIFNNILYVFPPKPRRLRSGSRKTAHKK